MGGCSRLPGCTFYLYLLNFVANRRPSSRPYTPFVGSNDEDDEVCNLFKVSKSKKVRKGRRCSSSSTIPRKRRTSNRRSSCTSEYSRAVYNDTPSSRASSRFSVCNSRSLVTSSRATTRSSLSRRSCTPFPTIVSCEEDEEVRNLTQYSKSKNASAKHHGPHEEKEKCQTLDLAVPLHIHVQFIMIPHHLGLVPVFRSAAVELRSRVLPLPYLEQALELARQEDLVHRSPLPLVLKMRKCVN